MSTLHLTLKNVCPALTGLATWTLVDESGRAGGRRSVKEFICHLMTGRDKASSHLLKGSWIQLPDLLLASNSTTLARPLYELVLSTKSDLEDFDCVGPCSGLKLLLGLTSDNELKAPD